MLENPDVSDKMTLSLVENRGLPVSAGLPFLCPTVYREFLNKAARPYQKNDLLQSSIAQHTDPTLASCLHDN